MKYGKAKRYNWCGQKGAITGPNKRSASIQRALPGVKKCIMYYPISFVFKMKVRRSIYMISHSLFTKYPDLHALKSQFEIMKCQLKIIT